MFEKRENGDFKLEVAPAAPKLTIAFSPHTGAFQVQCNGGMATARGLLARCFRFEASEEPSEGETHQKVAIWLDENGHAVVKSNVAEVTAHGVIELARDFYHETFCNGLKLSQLEQAQSGLTVPRRGFRS
jgi:hypothetical protein